MTENPNKSMQLVLTDDAAMGRITVEMEAFFDFSFWMAEELEDLVQRWRPVAPPRASNVRPSHLKIEKE